MAKSKAKTPHQEKAEEYTPLTPAEIKEIERMAACGLNQEDIIHNLDISRAKFYALKTIQSDISDAVKRGRANGLQKVSSALFSKATLDEDFNAQKFYLQSRGGADWNPAQNLNLGGSIQVLFQTDYGIKQDAK